MPHSHLKPYAPEIPSQYGNLQRLRSTFVLENKLELRTPIKLEHRPSCSSVLSPAGRTAPLRRQHVYVLVLLIAFHPPLAH